MKKNLWFGIIILLLIVGVIGFSVKGGASKSVATADNFDSNHTISVSGQGIVEATPDLASVNFGISVQKKTASESMDELSKLANRVVTTLKNFGIKEKDIKTTGISLNPVYQWNKDEKKNILVGYVATENFKVNTKLSDAGKVISLLTENGVNRIYGIYFNSSKAEELKKEAIAKAVEDAREKAKASLTGTNYKIVGIKTISIQSGYITPIYRNGFDNVAGEGKSNIPVEGGSMTIRATVNVVFIFD